MDDARRQERDLKRLEAEFRALRAMWESPLMVAQQQVRLLAKAGFRLVPGAVLRPGISWASGVRMAAIVAAVLPIVFALGVIVGWGLPGSPPRPP